MIAENRHIETFNKISFRDFGTLILTQGKSESLTIEADQELLSELIAEVRGDTLVLGIDDDWLNRIGKVISSVFNNEEHRIIYHLTFTDISEIKVSGKCTLQCSALTADNLKLKVSGLGNITIDKLESKVLDSSISGRGDFKISGRADEHKLRVSGSADVDAANLASQTAQITISGQGNATLRVQDSLDITISGLGQVNYYGQPKVRQVISGFGKSKRLIES
jgi:hypothetical protein